MQYEELLDANPDAIIWNGFEQAYIGYSYKPDTKDAVAVYDYYTMLDLVIEAIEDTCEEGEYETEDEIINEAIQHIDFNVIGGYLGEYTPIVMFKDA